MFAMAPVPMIPTRMIFLPDIQQTEISTEFNRICGETAGHS